MFPCEIIFQMCIDAAVILKRMDSFKSITEFMGVFGLMNFLEQERLFGGDAR